MTGFSDFFFNFVKNIGKTTFLNHYKIILRKSMLVLLNEGLLGEFESSVYGIVKKLLVFYQILD